MKCLSLILAKLRSTKVPSYIFYQAYMDERSKLNFDQAYMDEMFDLYFLSSFDG